MKKLIGGTCSVGVCTALVCLAAAAVACGEAAGDDVEGSDQRLTFDVLSTTADPFNAWMKGVDPGRLAIGQEVVLPNEEDGFKQLSEIARDIQEKTAPLNGGIKRAFHSKLHGCVLGELHVTPSSLPETRVGLFATEGTYPTWVRFSNSNPTNEADKNPDTRGLALKVMKVPGKKLVPGGEDAGTQDFVTFNSPIGPSDATHFVQIVKAVVDAHSMSDDPSLKLPGEISIQFPGVNFGTLRGLFAEGSFLFAAENRRSLQFILAGVMPRRFGGTVFGERYFSAAPVAMGLTDGDPMHAPARAAAQYRIVAGVLQGGTCTPATKITDPNDPDHDSLRTDLRARLKQGPACATLEVQFQRDPAKQLVEDSSVLWRESDTPFIPVGHLIMPQVDLDDPEGSARETFCNSLGFNPWHTLPEHRPLGNIQRARRVAYEESRERRGGGSEPTGDEFVVEPH